MHHQRLAGFLAAASLLAACADEPAADDGVGTGTDGGSDAAAEQGGEGTGGTDGPDGGASEDDSAEVGGTDDDSSTGDDGPRPIAPGIYPLDGLDQDLGSFDDLAPLADIIGDARFVGVGESTHTADAFLAGKARLVRYLVTEHGFRLVGLETPWYAMRDVGQYLQQCRGSATNVVIGSMFAVWADENMVQLVEWMCDWNTAHADDPVSFIGWDLQQPWHDGVIVQAAMEAVDPAALTTVFPDVDACNGVGYADFDAYVDSPEAAVWSGAPPDAMAHEQCVAGLQALTSWIDDHQAELLAMTSDDEVFWLRVARRGIEAWDDAAFHAFSDSKTSYEARDIANAHTIVEIAEAQYPDQRMVIWAHNAHLLRNSTVLHGGLGLGGAQMTGTVLSDTLGGDYVAVGLIGYDIDLTWFTPYDAPPADGPQAVERHLHELGEPYLLVDLDNHGDPPFPAGELFDLGHPIQGIESMAPAEQFDALIFADQSEGMHPAF